jgi:transposase
MNEIERPPADAGREEFAKKMVAEGFSPEEYAARFGHGWYCFSFGEVRFSDRAVDVWIQRLNDILFGLNGAPTIAELRAKLLTQEERQKIEKEIRDEAESL